MGSATSLQSAFTHCFDVTAWIGSFFGSLTMSETLETTLKSDDYKDLPVKFWYNCLRIFFK